MEVIFENMGALLVILSIISYIYGKLFKPLKLNKFEEDAKNNSSYNKLPKTKNDKMKDNIIKNQNKLKSIYAVNDRKDIGNRKITRSREDISDRKSINNRHDYSDDNSFQNKQTFTKSEDDLIRKNIYENKVNNEQKDKEEQIKQEKDRKERYKLDSSHNKDFKIRSKASQIKKSENNYSRHSYIRDMGNEFIEYADQFILSGDKYLEYEPGELYGIEKEYNNI